MRERNYGKNITKDTHLLLCFFLGWLGAHKFYEGNYFLGVVYLFTFGCCGIGWMIDTLIILFRPSNKFYSNNIVENYNDFRPNGKYNNVDFDLMDGHEFEEFCADLLRGNGFGFVKVTQASADHGIDITARMKNISYAIQCKCYSSNVGNSAIQQAYSGKTIYNADIAVVMTNSYFTKQAIEDAKKLNVCLWDRNHLVNLINKASKNNYSYSKFNCIKDNTTNHSDISSNSSDDIFTSGVYVMGESLKIGNYLAISKMKTNVATVKIYENYEKYKKNIFIHKHEFFEEYHIPLMEEGMLVEINDCVLKRL